MNKIRFAHFKIGHFSYKLLSRPWRMDAIGCVCVRFYSFTDSPFKWFRMILKTGLLCSLKCSLRIFTIDFDCIFSRLWNLFFLRIFRSLKISNTLRFGTVSMGEQKNVRIRRNGNADFISSLALMIWLKPNIGIFMIVMICIYIFFMYRHFPFRMLSEVGN